MHMDTRRKSNIAALLIFSLAITGAASFSHTNTVSTDDSEVGTLSVGASSDLFENSTENSLSVGAFTDVTDFSITSVADSNVTDVSTANKLFADTTYDENTTYGYKNIGFAQVKGNLNVRKKASKNASIAGKLTNNNVVEIVGESDDGKWLQIESGKLKGYVSSEYIVTGDEAKAIAEEQIATYATVKTNTLRVRSKPSTDSNIITKVNDEEDLFVTNVLDGWVEVELDDEKGYVAADYVTLANKFMTGKTMKELSYGNGVSDTRVALVEYALKFVGNRYVWGGTSLTNGVDCSGYTMQVYKKFGVKLPHSSVDQPNYGKVIKAKNAKPGDLFFYRRGSHRIGHVAIYIGNGKIVHASGRRSGIKISSAYYKTPVCVVSYLD